MSNEKLTIIPSDKFIGVGSTGYVGIGSDSDWNWIADNIHAVQWDGTSGHVEYNDGTSEVGLTTIRDYIQGYIDWDKETERIALEELKLEEEKDNIDFAKGLRHWRNIYLEESDWIVTKSFEEGVAVPSEWKEYRQSLRDFPHGKDSNTIKEIVKATNAGIVHSAWPIVPGGWTFS